MATFAVLHVEKDDQVRRRDWVNISHITITKSPRKHYFVKQVKISHNYGVSIFVLLLGLVSNTPLFTFLYNFDA
jgi:hypothetical protein